jgi:hypothetical protein
MCVHVRVRDCSNRLRKQVDSDEEDKEDVKMEDAKPAASSSSFKKP